jgi:hypothetical protein
MKVLILIGVTASAFFLASAVSCAAQAKKKQAMSYDARSTRVVSSQAKTLQIRKILIERKKAAREHLRNFLPEYEERLANQAAEYETSKILFEKDLISKLELDNRERALTNTRLEVERIRKLIAEDDLALSLVEDAAHEEMARRPKLALGGYEETPIFIRYNGGVRWSQAVVKKIEKFYRARFGSPLPVSARGQSPTHERMGLDHRNAVDVAVPPDSEEGQTLMSYLRRTGVPFVAFRGKVRAMSTGAHIHIGGPSPRIVEAKQRTVRRSPSNGDAANG